MLIVASMLIFGSVGQIDANLTKPEPYSKFHSNLGSQNLVEDVREDMWVGPAPTELASNVMPLGSMSNLSVRVDSKHNSKELVKVPPRVNSNFPGERRFNNWTGILPRQIQPSVVNLGSMNDFRYQYMEKLDMFLALQANSKPYWTNNALRLNQAEVDSWVWENSLSGSLESEPVVSNESVMIIPSLDLNMQFAEYQEKLFKDLLSYRYSSVGIGGRMEFPNNLYFGLSMDYSILHSLNEGEKMFDAVSPSLSISKFISFNEKTLLLLNSSLKYAFTERVINFSAEGIFSDDSDNLQLSKNLTLIRLLDSDGDFRLTGGCSLILSRYLKNEHDGRVDFTGNFSTSIGWYPNDWFSAELFSSFSIFLTNSKGEFLLGDSGKYKSFDTGMNFSLYKTF